MMGRGWALGPGCLGADVGSPTASWVSVSQSPSLSSTLTYKVEINGVLT